MRAITLDKLLEYHPEGPVFDVTLDGEDTLDYTEKTYFVRIPLRFVAFRGKLGQIVTYQSFGNKEQFHADSDAGWLLAKIMDGSWKK
jgi:hypothetical protein